MTDCKFELGGGSGKSKNENSSTIPVSPSSKVLPVDPVIPCNPGVHYFGNATRYLVLLISTLCLSLIMSNSLALNFTIICMSPETDSLSSFELITTTNQTTLNTSTTTTTTTNTTTKLSKSPLQFSDNGEKEENRKEVKKPLYWFSPDQKSLLFSATAIGTLIGTIPITFLTTKFGVRNIFTSYGLLSAISTLLTPFCAWLGFFPLFLMRIFQGFALAIGYPAMGSIISKWSTLKNSGMSVAFLSCHLQFGPIFTMPVSGQLCRSQFGWPAVFFLQGILTLIVFAGFYIFFRDSPQLHKNVSHKELYKIQQGRDIANEDDKTVPYKAMSLDYVVWGIVAMNLGGTLGFQIFMQYGPIYLNKVLKFDVGNTGLIAAVPYVLSAGVKFVVGPFSDYFTFISVKSRVILFATLSQFIMAACFVALYFLPSSQPTLIQICFTLCTVSSGLNCVGVAKSAQLISGQFAHVMMALCSFVSSFVILIIPLIVKLMAPQNTSTEWGRIFILIAVVVVLTTLIFDFTAEVEPRLWTYNQKKSMTKPIVFDSSNSPTKDISFNNFYTYNESAKKPQFQ